MLAQREQALDGRDAAAADRDPGLRHPPLARRAARAPRPHQAHAFMRRGYGLAAAARTV
jgi:hypothetical protein